MLTVHHLQLGQSERIVWLCEELGIDYELKTYPRDPQTRMSPPELKSLHPYQSAPVIQDGRVTLAETGAIVEYILAKYGGGKLTVAPDADNYTDYVFFLHFTNGSFQPTALISLVLRNSGADPNTFSAKRIEASIAKFLGILEDRLSGTTWLAGEDFTAADVMVVFTLTTMRLFNPYSLGKYPAILTYLGRVTAREAYKRALAKSDPGYQPVIAAEVPQMSSK